MMIPSATFVVLFIMVAMAGSRFPFWTVLTSIVYILGTIAAIQICKVWAF